MTRELHQVDMLTQYCTKCGAGYSDIANGRRDDCSSTNVIAISHIISMRRMNGMMNGFVTQRLMEDYEWPMK